MPCLSAALNGAHNCPLAVTSNFAWIPPPPCPIPTTVCVQLQLKERQGSISRVAPDGCSAVCKGLFKKESDISFFEGARVLTGRGEQGVIEVGAAGSVGSGEHGTCSAGFGWGGLPLLLLQWGVCHPVVAGHKVPQVSYVSGLGHTSPAGTQWLRPCVRR